MNAERFVYGKRYGKVMHIADLLTTTDADPRHADVTCCGLVRV
jgi:hypothetical protein